MEQDLFKNVIRVLAAAEEHAVVQFCEESGIVDRISTFPESDESGERVFIVWFNRASSAYRTKRRSRQAKLGGRSIRIDLLADNPALQDQYNELCQMNVSQDLSIRTSLLVSKRLEARSDSEKENNGPYREDSRSARYNHPPTATPRARRQSITSTPVGRSSRSFFDSSPALRRTLRNINQPITQPPSSTSRFSPDKYSRTPKPKPKPIVSTPRPHSSARLEHIRTSTPSKRVSFRASSSASNISNVRREGLPITLVRSPFILKDSARIADVFNSRSSTTPSLSRARSMSNASSRSLPVEHTVLLAKKSESHLVNQHASNRVHPINGSTAPASSLPINLELLKEELSDAKERYAQSLAVLKGHLAQVEQKYEGRVVMKALKGRVDSGF